MTSSSGFVAILLGLFDAYLWLLHIPMLWLGGAA